MQSNSNGIRIISNRLIKILFLVTIAVFSEPIHQAVKAGSKELGQSDQGHVLFSFCIDHFVDSKRISEASPKSFAGGLSATIAITLIFRRRQKAHS